MAGVFELVNKTVIVTLMGAELLQPWVDAAQGYASDAAGSLAAVEAAAVEADAAADEAEADATAAALSAGAAATSANDADQARLAAEAARDDAEAFASEAETSAATAGAAEAAVLTAIGDIDVGASPTMQATTIAAMQAISIAGLTEGTQVRVDEDRVGGPFKWRAGNQSANITAAKAGLWKAPTEDLTGASGAWERVIFQKVWFAEWWLPAVMPANADVQLNAMSGALSSGITLFTPPREVTQTAAWIVRTPRMTIKGCGREGLLRAPGTGIECLVVAADDVLVDNLYGGYTVGGSFGGPESPVFHVFDANNRTGGTGFYRVGNVTFINCGAINCETGIRIGYSVNGSEEVFESHDCKVINFYGEGTGYHGIELFNSRRAQVIGGQIICKVPNAGMGSQGIRVNACEDTLVDGLRVVGYSETTTLGCKVDSSDAKTNTYLPNVNTQIVNCTFDNCQADIDVHVHEGKLLIANNISIGRTDGNTDFISADAHGTSHTRKCVIEHMEVRGNQVSNKNHFAFLSGTILKGRIEANTFDSNNATDPKAILVNGFTGEKMNIKIRDNRFAVKAAGSTPNTIRLTGTFDVGSHIYTLDDNEITPDHLGNMFPTAPGTGIIFRMRNPYSNKRLIFGPASTPTPWATATSYSVGDIRGSTTGGVSFTAIVAHTSGATFAADLVAGKWAITSWLNERPALGLAEYN